MPRFMGFVRMEEGVGTPPQALFDAMDEYIGERASKGIFLDGGGLYGTEDAVNYVVRQGEVTRVDGPYSEAKEVVGGWAIMEFPESRGGRRGPAVLRRAPCQALARGHGDPYAAPDLDRPGGARRLTPDSSVLSLPAAAVGGRAGSLSRYHYAGVVPARTRPDDPNGAVYAVWRTESARLVGGLTRMTRDVSLAEDLAQDALVAALEQWPETGVPDNPIAWLMTVAKRRAIDHFRRTETMRRKVVELGDASDRQAAAVPDVESQVDYIEDDVLRLVFLSCNPVLTPESRAALTLRLVGGLTTAEIARGFLVTESTMGQRISRAKKTLSESHAEFELPVGAERTERLDDVMAVIYLIFNEGYTATAGEDWMRQDLVDGQPGWRGCWSTSLPTNPKCSLWRPSSRSRARGCRPASTSTGSRSCWRSRTVASGIRCASGEAWRPWGEQRSWLRPGPRSGVTSCRP